MALSNKSTIKRKIAGEVNTIVFAGTLMLYLVLLILENLSKGFITATFNPNYVLIVIAGSGILNFFLTDDSVGQSTPEQSTYKDFVYIFILAAAGFLITRYSTREIEDFSWILSAFVGLVTVLIGIVLLQPDSQPSDDT